MEFYTPSNYDVENIIIMAYYKEGSETPTFLYFMDGLNAVKLILNDKDGNIKVNI